MKVSREQVEENRERILDMAAKLFRERGFDGVCVADLMAASGLTHGGFYGHFSSKDDLMAQASARAMANSLVAWKQRIADTDGDPLTAITTPYLSIRHRDHPGDGCLFAALGADITRGGLPLRHTVTEGLRSLIDVLARLIPGRSQAVKRQKALATYAGLIGALVLARAVDDPTLSDEILQAVSTSLAKAAPAKP